MINNLQLPDEVVDFPHKGSTSLSELAWARTYLKNFGVIENSARAVWSIRPEFAQENALDAKHIVQTVVANNRLRRLSGTQTTENDNPEDDGVESPEEVKPWRQRLLEILQGMDPFGFERLTQRILRECGFSQVEVTKNPETEELTAPGNCASTVSSASMLHFSVSDTPALSALVKCVTFGVPLPRTLKKVY